MKLMLVAAAAAAALAAAAPAFAADDLPKYEKGPVWDFGSIKTKDGSFDDYMKWVTTAWKAQQEGLKKEGVILDYKVYLVMDPRGGDPDIILATEYKNLAVLDHPVAEDYAIQAKIAGSIAKQNKEQAERGAIRSVLSDMLVREAVIK